MAPGNGIGLAAAAALTVCGSLASADPPNVLLILADDLGYSDLGCFGGEISTPHLDALAREGVRFTQHYNAGRCWPTRAALLTGFYPQAVRRDTVPGVPSGGAGVRPAWAPLLCQILRPVGYRSYHSGKWHLDGPALAAGFDRSLRIEDHDRPFSPQQVLRDDRRVEPASGGRAGHVTTMIADHAIACLEDHAASHRDRRFFAFVAFTAPHFPLQADAGDIARSRQRYAAGWDEVRAARWRRLRELGISAHDLAPAEVEVGPPYSFPDAMTKLGPLEVNRPVPWSSLGAATREFQAEKMAIHAAMVEGMDREVGRILAALASMSLLDNTAVFFLSDNGASAEIMVRGDGHDPRAPLGSSGSFLCLGPGWSSAANSPFRRHKTWMHEGGIATPLIVRYPRAGAGRGELRRAVTHVVDFVPTVLELAGVAAAAEWSAAATPARPGRSLVAALAGDPPPRREPLWWLHEGNRALRAGDWKLVAAGDGAPWELYDLSRDRGEIIDLAGRLPEKARELERLWDAQRQSIFRSAGAK